MDVGALVDKLHKKECLIDLDAQGQIRTIDDKPFQKYEINLKGPFVAKRITRKRLIAQATFLNYQDEAVFTGMLVREKGPYRGTNMSNALMMALFDVTDGLGLNLDRTSIQYKPITNFILSKYGFTPENTPNVDILERQGDELRIRFHNWEDEAEFKDTSKFKSGQYQIVNGNEPAIGQVAIPSRYILTDLVKNQEQRNKYNDRFEIRI